jgi:hypothetical protein
MMVGQDLVKKRPEQSLSKTQTNTIQPVVMELMSVFWPPARRYACVPTFTHHTTQALCRPRAELSQGAVPENATPA